MNHQNKQNILFFVAGMTPQIITETVWALACDKSNPNPWLPDEIVVLSTTTGLNQIKGRLFEQKVFDDFKKEYPQLKNIQFDERSLVVIEHNGAALEDIKTPAENEIMADQLCAMIAELTQKQHVSLHVSIAGGRKTMGYYAGYALSIYGRKQDALSHVLVETKFESGSNFFYPTSNEKLIYNHDKQVIGNAQDAKVWLAQIPFVRMRGMLDEESILNHKKFSEVVALIGHAMQPVCIKIINTDERKVFVGNQFCKLAPKEFAMYLLAAKMRLKNEYLIYPNKEIENDSIQKNAQDEFNQIYAKHKPQNAPEYTIIDYAYMNNVLATMKRKFKKAFGDNIAAQICIQKMDAGKGYGLILAANHIDLLD